MSDYPLKLQLYISRAGIASRRKAADFITEKRVKVNNRVILEPWHLVQEQDTVSIDNKAIKLQTDKKIYIALYKPPRYLTSNYDPQGRPLAIDLIKPIVSQRLFHVGRLDYNSSGLIIYTNDGDFAQTMSHPSFEIEKEYLVTTRYHIPEELLNHWLDGITIEGVTYYLEDYQLQGEHSVKLTLLEGRNREIRTVFNYHNIPLKRVHRKRIGNITLRNLQPGQFRLLQKQEIRYFQKRSSK